MKNSRYVLIVLLWLLGHSTILFATDGNDFIQFDKSLHQQGVLLVRFTEQSGLRLSDDGVLNSTTGQVSTQRVQQLQSDLRWKRMSSLSEKKLDDLYQKGRNNKNSHDLVNLNRYARVVLDDSHGMQQWMETISSWQEVEKVFPMPMSVEAPSVPDYTTPNAENFSSTFNTNLYQQYFDDFPAGLGFRMANGTASVGLGLGVKVCDVEYNYNSQHADLKNVTELNASVGNNGWGPDHGTAVLGILGSLDNGVGTKGIVPDAQLFFSRPYTDTGSYSISEGLLVCADAMDAGDVVLIEQQIGGPNYVSANSPSQVGLVPVEWYEPYYDTIKSLTDAGYIVVEAGGNGGEDLDSSDYTTGNAGHYPFNGSKDSGAILVGAAKSGINPNDTALTPQNFSSYGSRIDVFAWGDTVVSTGYGSLWNNDGVNQQYSLFSGTSSASPLITSAVVIAQGLYTRVNGVEASSSLIRNLLRNNGRNSVGSRDIGVMPDMQLLVNSIASNASTPVLQVGTPGGNYNLPMQVAVSVVGASTNDIVRYTLDGSEPDFDQSYLFEPWRDTQLTIFVTSTLKIKAWRYDAQDHVWISSATQTYQYTNTTQQVATPAISPGGGQFSGSTQLVLTTATPGAVIKYRLDGKRINFLYPGTTYSSPVTLGTGSYEVVAKAYKSGMNSSEQAESSLITVTAVQLPAPTVYPNGGSFVDSVTVYAGSTVLGADLRCTIDGSEPNQTTSLQMFDPIQLNQSATLKCKVFLAGYTPSQTVSKNFTVNSVAPVLINPPNGTSATGSLNVSMVNLTPGTAIRYTLSGSEPTQYSTLYTGSFNLGVGQHVVKAKAFLSTGDGGPVSTSNYTVYTTAAGVQAPTMTPFSTQTFANSFQIIMQTDTEGADIYYNLTTDGSLVTDPDRFSSRYNGPLFVSQIGDYRFKIVAYKNGVYSPIVASGTVSLVSPLGSSQLPVMDPPPGIFHNSVSVTMTAGPSEVIYYTKNGEDPTIVPPALFPTQQYNGPVNIFSSTTLKATSYRVFFANSGQVTGEYHLQCAQPVAILTDNQNGTGSVSLSSVTNNASIHYTLDGSEPTTSSSLYTSPISLSANTHHLRTYCTRSGYTDSPQMEQLITIQPQLTAPQIDTQPQSATYLDGEQAVLYATASAYPEPDLQWYKNGQPIAGAVFSEFVIDAYSSVHAGSYYLKATNSVGTVDSVTVTLSADTETVFRSGFESSKKSVEKFQSMKSVPFNRSEQVSLFSDLADDLLGKPEHENSLTGALAKTTKRSNGLNEHDAGPGGGTVYAIPALSPGALIVLALLLIGGGSIRFYMIKEE
ncbi:MAG: chitobiase/beta-hexosaminidase C-terminal domain-containing protein [bacterium]